jgi:hypothetical protein
MIPPLMLQQGVLLGVELACISGTGADKHHLISHGLHFTGSVLFDVWVGDLLSCIP